MTSTRDGAWGSRCARSASLIAWRVSSHSIEVRIGEALASAPCPRAFAVLAIGFPRKEKQSFDMCVRSLESWVVEARQKAVAEVFFRELN